VNYRFDWAKRLEYLGHVDASQRWVWGPYR
jgi:hypothetical protein